MTMFLLIAVAVLSFFTMRMEDKISSLEAELSKLRARMFAVEQDRNELVRWTGRNHE